MMKLLQSIVFLWYAFGHVKGMVKND